MATALIKIWTTLNRPKELKFQLRLRLSEKFQINLRRTLLRLGCGKFLSCPYDRIKNSPENIVSCFDMLEAFKKLLCLQPCDL